VLTGMGLRIIVERGETGPGPNQSQFLTVQSKKENGGCPVDVSKRCTKHIGDTETLKGKKSGVHKFVLEQVF